MMKQWLIRGRSEYLSSATPRLPSLRLCRLLSSAPRHIPLTLVPLPSLRNFHYVATSRSPGWRYRDRKPRQHLGCAARGNQDWLDQAKLGRFDRGAQRDIVAGMHDGNLDDCLGLRRLDQAGVHISSCLAVQGYQACAASALSLMHLGAPVMQVAKRCVGLPAARNAALGALSFASTRRVISVTLLMAGVDSLFAMKRASAVCTTI